MEKVKINKAGSLPAVKPPEISFTGEVLISNYFEGKNPSKLIGATVTFKPGSRTPWKWPNAYHNQWYRLGTMRR